VATGKLVLSAGEGFLWIAIAAGAFMEELAFRVIAIDEFIRLMDGIKARAFWAILASSALFTGFHLPSKSLVALQGIFISSLIFGYVYYKTRSVLFPAWFHAVSNAGFSGGMLAVALYCLVATLSISRASNKRAPLAAVASSRSCRHAQDAAPHGRDR
jgi:membrane protease YdiL (CAAX protease family)